MSTNKWIDRICVAGMILALLLTVLFMNGKALGIPTQTASLGYEERLFDTSRVHTIHIVMDEWDGFIETCENEEYSMCTVIIDGESFSNVGIRAKGNTSLSSVASMNSSRYSFKIEFDQYDNTKTYYGLDKLSLNNLIQDNTLMKDYLVYQMMGQMGVAAPLCSYVYITVNGEDWGLYLAVEAIEESFLQRNYGTDYGELYKPDSMSNGGGRGNGKDFRIDDWQNGNTQDSETDQPQRMPGDRGQNVWSGQMPENFDPSAMSGEMREDFDPSAMIGQMPEGFDPSAMTGQMPTMGGGMGSGDVKLQYTGDDPSSYSNIFNNAKTDITTADQERLIQSLEKLSAWEDLENTVDVESVIRYFVVHSFVCNDDSYTGTMVHNYYLYEEDGQLSMLPWDYNLAFSGFQSSNAASVVNSSISSIVSGGTLSDRPMAAWIFDSGEYEAKYYEVYQELLDTYFTEDTMSRWIGETGELIAPYVEKDPTKFCTTEEFEAGVTALQQFMQLRSQSVQLQLSGEEGTVDASGLELSDMGSMGMGGGMTRPGDMGNGMPMPGSMGGGMSMPQGDFGQMGKQKGSAP